MDFFLSLITELIHDGHTVDIATNEYNGEARVNQIYKDLGCTIYPLSCSRSPLRKGNIDCVREIKKIVTDKHYDIVHCHTPIAAACTRLACRKARKNGNKVIYTAHGFHFYDGAPLKNWLIFYPIEKWLSRYTDVLITINKEDYKRVSEHLHAKKTVYIPGVGIDLSKFKSGLIDIKQKKEELGICDNYKVLLSVGELSTRKNHRVVIEALAKVQDSEIHYYIAGKGELNYELEQLAKEQKVNLHLLGYRSDVNEIIQIADLFVLPSQQEGLSVALMEAIACKVPVVCSDIRGNIDLIRDKNYLFKATDVDDVARVIETALLTDNSNAVYDNYEQIKSFDLSVVGKTMNDIYGGGIRRLIFRKKLCEELRISQSCRIVLSVGELNKNKNHEIVIRALSGIKNVVYMIAGKGELKDELKKIADECNVQLCLLGYRTDVADLYKSCDLYVLPSRREGLNVSLMEAMASGANCICSDIRGNRDLLEKQYRVQGFSIQDWKDMITSWPKNGNNCACTIKAFSKENVYRAMKGLYSE